MFHNILFGIEFSWNELLWMKSIRILFVTRSLPFHGLGGMETVAWDLARAFSARGHDVAVLTTACPALAAESVIEGVTIYAIDAPSGRYSRAWWRAAKAFYRTRLRGHIDIVLSISAGAMSLATSREAIDPARYFVQAHGTLWGEIASKLASVDIKNWAKALLALKWVPMEFGYRRFDGMITIGPNVTRDASRYPMRFLLGPLPLDEIPNGIDTTKFRFDPVMRAEIRARYGLAGDAPVLLALSRLHNQKGIQHSLDSFARAYRRNPALRFVIVGSGPHEAQLRRIATSLQNEAAVIFAGAISREEVPAFYAAADAFIFTTTRVEGLPLNILEALACGLPVILSRHIALADHRHQYPVDPQDHDAVAETIGSVLALRPDAKSRTGFLDRGYWLSTAVDRYLDLFAARLAELS